MASSDPRFDNNAILDCTVKLCRLSGPRTWTTVPGNSRLLLVKIEKSGEAKCQIIVHNNLGKLVLNAYILEGVALKVQMGKENCFVTKLWPRTVYPSTNCCRSLLMTAMSRLLLLSHMCVLAGISMPRAPLSRLWRPVWGLRRSFRSTRQIEF